MIISHLMTIPNTGAKLDLTAPNNCSVILTKLFTTKTPSLIIPTTLNSHYIFRGLDLGTWNITITDLNNKSITSVITLLKELVYELKLPLSNEYQQIEYLQNSNTQYINTGLVLSTEYFKIVSDMTVVDITNSGNYLWGHDSDSTNWFCFEIYSNNARCNTGSNAALDTGITTSTARTYCEHTAANGTLTLNCWGTTKSFTYSGSIASSYPIGLFTGNRSGTFTSYIADGLRIYSNKMYVDSDFHIARDFYPCIRVSDNVAGLYDIIGKLFYTNVGSNTFITGENFEAIL